MNSFYRVLPTFIALAAAVPAEGAPSVVEEARTRRGEVERDAEDGPCVISTVELNANGFPSLGVGAIEDTASFYWYADPDDGRARLARAVVRQVRNGYRIFVDDYLFDDEGDLVCWSHLHRVTDHAEPLEESAFYFADGALSHVDYDRLLNEEETAAEAELVLADAESVRAYFLGLLKLPDPLTTAWATRNDSG